MYRCKMIFSDIDGTLLDSDNRLRPATRDKILELAAAGTVFILASARSGPAMRPVWDELGLTFPIVSMGGALVLDGEGHALRSVGMPLEVAVELKALVESRWPGIVCSAYVGPRWVVDRPDDPWVKRESLITGESPRLESLTRLPPDSQVNKLLCVGDPEELDCIQALVSERYPSLAAHKSWESYLEIQDRGATKGDAVRYLCEREGVPVEETISFGDNFNDVDMLLTTGLGFAMGNAPEEVKRRVGRVTGSNDEDGVLTILQMLTEGTLNAGTGRLPAKAGRATIPTVRHGG